MISVVTRTGNEVAGDLDAIVRSWELSGSSELEPGASYDALQEAQRKLGRTFPLEFAALYRRFNGGGVVGGNIIFYPLDGEDPSVVQSSGRMRTYDWPIPDELLVFASDGSDDLFGLWLPKTGARINPVIEVGQNGDDGGFSIHATSFFGFLRGRTAYYLLLQDDEIPRRTLSRALDAIGVPSALRTPGDDLGEEEYDALLRWANPGLPETPLSDACLTADDISRFVEQAR
jgi:hypothetical protein